MHVASLHGSCINYMLSCRGCWTLSRDFPFVIPIHWRQPKLLYSHVKWHVAAGVNSGGHTCRSCHFSATAKVSRKTWVFSPKGSISCALKCWHSCREGAKRAELPLSLKGSKTMYVIVAALTDGDFLPSGVSGPSPMENLRVNVDLREYSLAVVAVMFYRDEDSRSSDI